jgi:hypothetical protein
MPHELGAVPVDKVTAGVRWAGDVVRLCPVGRDVPNAVRVTLPGDNAGGAPWHGRGLSR